MHKINVACGSNDWLSQQGGPRLNGQIYAACLLEMVSPRYSYVWVHRDRKACIVCAYSGAANTKTPDFHIWSSKRLSVFKSSGYVKQNNIWYLIWILLKVQWERKWREKSTLILSLEKCLHKENPFWRLMRWTSFVF